MSATKIIECLACGGTELLPMLDLGQQPLANNFRIDPAQQEPEYPLAVNMCGQCHHLQLTDAVDPRLIYENYLYVSGTSKTYTHYMGWYARWVREQYQTQHQRHAQPVTVLDIGCNDGSQLDAFSEVDPNLQTYGVDPAANLHDTSSRKGHRVALGFWDAGTAGSLKATYGVDTFDVITSQNAFAHIPDPLGYLQAVNQVMHDDSLMFISTSQADMVLNDEFDTIYHEHISFYNAKSMSELARRAGLYLQDVIKTPIHGVSYVFVLGRRPVMNRVHNVLAMEQYQGLYTDDTYAHWAANTRRLIEELRVFVGMYRSKGWVIGGYGAAAKGMTLLNATGLTLDFIVDDNPLKQGRWTPGIDTPIVGIDHLDQYDSRHKILFVPLAWNFFDEIRAKILAKRQCSTDRFLKYFPKVELI